MIDYFINYEEAFADIALFRSGKKSAEAVFWTRNLPACEYAVMSTPAKKSATFRRWCKVLYEWREFKMAQQGTWDKWRSNWNNIYTFYHRHKTWKSALIWFIQEIINEIERGLITVTRSK